MNIFVRASGFAAAALALVAGATFAEPSMAIEANAAPAVSFMEHAEAATDGTNQAFANSAESAAELAAKIAGVAYTAIPRPRSLNELAEVYSAEDVSEEQQACLAKAVYFEARGESLEGQLAVANVVLNRASSGRYPETICEVVTQKAQFSFIEDGQFPEPKKGTKAWRKAVAVARIAREKIDTAIPEDVLWYHADYVQPIWRHGLKKVDKVGQHIFYRGKNS